MADDAASLDLSSSVYLDSFSLSIMKPGTSEPTGWTIELAGPAHPLTVAMANAISRENIEKEKAIEFAQVNQRKWKIEPETVEDRRRKNVMRVCQRIIGWSPNPIFKHFSPEPIAFSVSVATELFLRPDMGGFFVQVTDYLTGERAFTPPSEPI